MLQGLKRRLRHLIAQSWWLSKAWYRLHGHSVQGQSRERVWYFAFGSNMNERVFRERRHMTPIETRTARLDGYRLRFAIAGRRSPGASARFVELIQGIDQVAAGGRKPGVSAPADIMEAPGEHVWGVLYLLPFRKFVRLDASELEHAGHDIARGGQIDHVWSPGATREEGHRHRRGRGAPHGRPNTEPCGIPLAFPPWGQVLSSMRKPGALAPGSRKRSSSANRPVALSNRAITTRCFIPP